MWEDKVLYWAWRGGDKGYAPPPTNKTIVYGMVSGQEEAIGVFDDAVYTKLKEPDEKIQ
jgi:hypothetical protein